LSFTSDLTEIWNDYTHLRERFQILAKAQPVVNKGRIKKNQQFADDTAVSAIKFLRNLDVAATNALGLVDMKTQILAARTKSELNGIRSAFEGDFDTLHPTYDRVDLGKALTRLATPTPNNFGGNSILGFIDSENWGFALSGLLQIRSLVLAILQDIGLFYSLKMLPVEERSKIKLRLSERDMSDISERLNAAEGHFIAKKDKDCVGNSREVLAQLVHHIRKNETGRTSDSMEGDLSELTKVRIVSVEEKRMMIDLYSFLSQKWKTTKEVSSSEAELGLKQTYFFVARLLDSFESKSRLKGDISNSNKDA
jgi:hypothetical protein